MWGVGSFCSLVLFVSFLNRGAVASPLANTTKQTAADVAMPYCDRAASCSNHPAQEALRMMLPMQVMPWCQWCSTLYCYLAHMKGSEMQLGAEVECNCQVVEVSWR